MTVLAASNTGEAVGFWILAPIAVLGAIAMVLAKKAVHAALFLAAVMLSLAGLYACRTRRSWPPCRSSSTPARS